MDISRLLLIAVQAGAFISAFAAIAAGIIMTRVTKKFGTGILASGFKTISLGIFLIALGIVFDAVQVYFGSLSPQIVIALTVLKEIFFVLGTYVIVIGSKRTGDKLESLTK